MRPPQNNLPELLLPAGDAESLATALLYGADAVYLGADGPNLRARAAGFGGGGLAQAVRDAHASGVRVYVCVNATPRQGDLPLVEQGLEQAVSAGADGLIIADPGVLRLARRLAPRMPVHISTQANTRNMEACAQWRELGASRANLARECAAGEVMELCAARDRELPGFELELFAHGAQCMAFSGRCQLSVHMTGRAVNQAGRTASMGSCAHPCRYEYRLRGVVEERKRSGANPGEAAWEVVEHRSDTPGAPGHEAWTQFFAPQDLCLVWQARWLARLGVNALKIEGRTRSSAYLAVVADAWRFALDGIAHGDFQPRAALAELRYAASRPLTQGLFGSDPGRPVPGVDATQPRPMPLLRVLGPAEGDAAWAGSAWQVEVKGTFDPGRAEGLTLILPGLRRPVLAAGSFALERDGLPLATAHPGMRAVLRVDGELAAEIRPGLFAR